MSVQVFQTPVAQTEPLPLHPDTNPLTVLNEADRLHFAAAYQVARAEVGPKAEEMERAGRIAPALIRLLARYGFFGVQAPEQLGGSGMGLFHTVLAVEALARFDASVALLVDVHNTLLLGAVNTFGDRRQRFRYLPQLADGSLIGAFSLSEAHAGSDAFALSTRAEPTGDGYRLNGAKAWVSGAREAGLFLVFARATPDPAGAGGGIATFLVRRDNPGLTVGPPESKLGLRASSTCPLFLKDCFVPAEDRLGGIGEGRRLAMSLLNEGRIGIAAQMVGIAQAALDLAIGYARKREAFGRPIGRNQAVAFSLAEAALKVETARVLTWNAARLADTGGEVRYAAAMAKLTAQRTAEAVTSLAIEIHGGAGYTTDNPAGRLWRDAKAGTIYEGAANMQLMTIARGLRL